MPGLLALTNAAIPLGKALIGLGVLAGAFVRPASFLGAFLMAFVYLGNGDFAHGHVNGDPFGLVLFGSLMASGGGRIYAVDRWLEATDPSRRRPWLGDLLG